MRKYTEDNMEFEVFRLDDNEETKMRRVMPGELEKSRRKSAKKQNKKARISASANLPVIDEETAARRRERRRKWEKRKRRAKRTKRIVAAVLALVIAYSIAVFSEIPVIAKWRTIYIQTAMTTKSHQWLATYFIPGFVIDRVMADTQEMLDSQKDLSSDWENSILNLKKTFANAEDEFFSIYWELDTDSVRSYLRGHSELTADGYDNIKIEDFDEKLGLETINGDSVLVVDTANNLVIVGVSGDGFRGKLAIVKDPSQVELMKSKTFGSVGQEVATYGEENDAIVAINASRFVDVGGHGNGANVKGSLVLDGKEYGNPEKGYWRFAGFKDDNRLTISSYDKAEISDYKWGLEVYPALVVNGEKVLYEMTLMGIQPRASIGQTQEGDFMLLIVDGRQVGYSLGCTVLDCADILMDYNAYQAMNLDGGSSAVMWYDGELITSSSSVSGRGRYLPDAIIVKKASATEPDTSE